MKLIFATSNQNKATEIRQLASNTFEILTLTDIGFTGEIAETGNTLHENASIKSRYISYQLSVDCFADDSGLEVEALNGAPGVYSARYAGEPGNDTKNTELLLQNLETTTNRNARFVTVISLQLDNKEFFFEGELKGTIISKKRGTNGFGYDPVFVPEGYTQTLAELSLAEKNSISHRARAFYKLVDFLKTSKSTG